MKRVIQIVMLLVVLAGGYSCKKRVIIPDDTLTDIFRDAFLTNAYIDSEGVNTDTLLLYEPIFRRYGYTAEDVRYTVGNFSRRKSARLGSVVEEAITQLEERGRILARQVVILDTIREVALRTYTRTVYEDSLIKARRRADSTRLRIVIEPVWEGSYQITYKVECEDLEEHPRRSEFYFEDENGIRNGNALLSMRKSMQANRTLVSRNDNNKRLVIELGNYRDKGRPSSQSLTIRDLKVVYKPTDEIAVDSLYNSFVPIRIFADEFFVKKDSLALSADAKGVDGKTPDKR